MNTSICLFNWTAGMATVDRNGCVCSYVFVFSWWATSGDCQVVRSKVSRQYFSITMQPNLNSSPPSAAYMRDLGHHWFIKWLVAWSMLSHYLNQCWNIVNWTLRNKLKWNFLSHSKKCNWKGRLRNGNWPQLNLLQCLMGCTAYVRV